MGKYVAEQTVKQMIAAGSPSRARSVNVLGLTFKENCPDLRNCKVIDVIHELRSFRRRGRRRTTRGRPRRGACDEYGVALSEWSELPRADALIAAVAHREYRAADAGAVSPRRSFPVAASSTSKSCFDAVALRRAGLSVWRL